ncbi:MAG: carbon-nitrogen family hydrolase [Methanomethylovorans sp.]|nr:carbon-nitrogen family hydrolase [Methanomethylovorans sp.]
MEVMHCSKVDNFKKAMSMAANAVLSGADILVLPEVFTTGFCYERISHMAEEAPFPTLDKLIEFSKTNKCAVIGSIIEMQTQKAVPTYYNLGFCVEHGKLVGIHRKCHLFKKEQNYFSAGNSIHPIFLEKYGVCIGLEICYELRFPEISRKLALEGADILITIAQFPYPRNNVWKTLALARSIENQIPHIACNIVGSSPSLSFFGGSLIIDASGNILAEADEMESIIIHAIDLEKTTNVRSEITVFADRREDLYK